MRDLFAEQYYKGKYIYIDFEKDSDARNFINGNGENENATVDPTKIIEYFYLREGKKIDENTLLLFNEIQEALPIIASLKYFREDYPRIPVIATGSIVRIKLRREQTVAKQHKKGGIFIQSGQPTRSIFSRSLLKSFCLTQMSPFTQKSKTPTKKEKRLSPACTILR